MQQDSYLRPRSRAHYAPVLTAGITTALREHASTSYTTSLHFDDAPIVNTTHSTGEAQASTRSTPSNHRALHIASSHLSFFPKSHGRLRDERTAGVTAKTISISTNFHRGCSSLSVNSCSKPVCHPLRQAISQPLRDAAPTRRGLPDIRDGPTTTLHSPPPQTPRHHSISMACH